MVVIRFLICLACFLRVDGVRISARTHAVVRSPITVGADGEPWVKGTKYVCMQKWQYQGSKFVKSFCLANYAKKDKIATEHFHVAQDLELCASKKMKHMMKLCALKGEASEARLSYSTKVHVAKSCFRFSREDVAFPVIEAAVDEHDCTMAMTESAVEQGVIQATKDDNLLEKEDSSPDLSSSFVESRSTSQVGPDGEPWVQGTKYVCMQKWQNGGVTPKFVDSFCLANHAKAAEIATAHFEAKDLASCTSTKFAHQMKLCALKGEAPNGRVSYSTKVHVAKSCFRFSSDDDALFPVIEAAVDEHDCTMAMTESAVEQGVILARTTTTTTTTIEDIVEAEFDDTHEEIEAKALFLAGDEKLWDYYGKAFKCCISSAGKPTKLQDMLAEKLPVAPGRFGRRTGCGYMFGDTYHNGPKHYNKCPLLLPVLKKMTGDDFEAIKSYLA